MNEINIVELIEKNPITKLSNNYNNKLLNKTNSFKLDRLPIDSYSATTP